MQLTINDEEIKEAITEYVKNQGISTVDKEVSIELTAGRNGNGHKATITIVNVQDTPSGASTKPSAVPAAPLTELEEVVFDVAGANSEEETEVNEDGDTGSSTAESPAPTSIFQQK